MTDMILYNKRNNYVGNVVKVRSNQEEIEYNIGTVGERIEFSVEIE